MLYFSKLRIIFITLISLLFIIFALSNLFNFDNKILNKKINLGLDLQGGSYLLLEIDNDPVIEQKLQNLTVTIRNFFKEKNVSCLLYTSPSPRDQVVSRMPSSA